MVYTIGRCLIGDLLKHRDWSQRYLSSIADVPKSNLSDYIRNENVISLLHAKNVSEALECSIEDLYEWIPLSTE